MTKHCLTCCTLMDSHVDPHPYGRGINVVIDNAVVCRCPSCGEVEVEIQNIEGLHAAIATALVQKPGLTTGEMRWLQSHHGSSTIIVAEASTEQARPLHLIRSADGWSSQAERAST